MEALYENGCFKINGVHAAGVTFGDRQSNLRMAQLKQEEVKRYPILMASDLYFYLKRDYDNLFDDNAVKIIARCTNCFGEERHRDCGFLPRLVAEEVAPVMDAGRFVYITDVAINAYGKFGGMYGLVCNLFWDATDEEYLYLEKQAQAVG